MADQPVLTSPDAKAAVASALASARSMIGKNEVPNHQELMDYLHGGGEDLDPHKSAWCAAFVSAALTRAGIPIPQKVASDLGPGPGIAVGSYRTWGDPVNPRDVQAGDLLIANNTSHMGFANGPMRMGPNGPEAELIAGNETDTSGRYTPGSFTTPEGVVKPRAQVGMVGDRVVPLSQYSIRRYNPNTAPPTVSPSGEVISPGASAQPSPGATASPRPAQGTTLTSTPLSPTDRDWVIRTIAGEADHPAGDAAVASVIRNRQMSGQWGPTAQSVVTWPGEFSALNRLTGYKGGVGANNLVNLSPDSATYQRIGKIVDNVWSGQTSDPTNGALNFYAPSGMPGGKAPSWWSQVDNPIRIGGQWYGTAAGQNQLITGRAPASTVAATAPATTSGAPGAPSPASSPAASPPGAAAAPPTPGTTLTAPPPAPPAPGAPTPAATPGAPAPTTPGTTLTSTPAAPTGGVASIGQALGLSPQAAGGFQTGLSNLSKGLGGPSLEEQKPGQAGQAGQQQTQPLEIRPSPMVGELATARNVPGPMGVEQQARMRLSSLVPQQQPFTGAPPGFNPWIDPKFGTPYGPSVPGTTLGSMGPATQMLAMSSSPEMMYGYNPAWAQQTPGFSLGGYNG